MKRHFIMESFVGLCLLWTPRELAVTCCETLLREESVGFALYRDTVRFITYHFLDRISVKQKFNHNMPKVEEV
jgi:hypothetical protein